MQDNIDEIYFKHLYRQIEENKDYDIFFWGASLFLENFLNQFPLSQFSIQGIIDSSASKVGKEVCGYRIFPPSILENEKKAKIIFTIKNNFISAYNSINKDFELLPNIFKATENDVKFEELASNKIYLVNSLGEKKQVSNLKNLEVHWFGKNSIIEIGADPLPAFRNCKISCGDNVVVKIGSSEYKIIFEACLKSENSYLEIGENFYCGGMKIRTGTEPDTKLIIGDDCMFSEEIYIRISDGHTVYDIETNEAVNPPKPIKIGNHVWLGNRTTVLKNTQIPNNTIVGAASLINRAFDEENTAIAGVPARIIKKNVNWSHKNLNDYKRSYEEDL